MAGSSAIVIGAGIAGLCAAYRLQQAGVAVEVLEAEDFVGGRMSSIERGGFVFNRAASVLPRAYHAVSGLAEELGFGDQLEAFHGITGTLREGVVHPIRSNRIALDVLRTKLIPWRSKLKLPRVAVDALRMKSSLEHADLGVAARFDTQTAAEYCARRLDQELAQYLVEPAVRGLSATASVVEFFNVSMNILGGGFLRYPGGIGFLTEALAERVAVRTGARARRVEEVEGGVRVSWEQDGSEHSRRADACVIAVPSCHVAALYPQLEARCAEILRERLRYTTSFIAHFGLRTRPAQPAMLVLVPEREHPWLYSVSFDHHLRPDAVPAGKGQIGTYWMHEWCEQRLELEDEELVEQMLPALEPLVPGIREQIEVRWIDRWRPAILDGSPGYCEAIAELLERLDPNAAVQLAGDYFSTSSSNAAILSAERAVMNLLTRAG